MKGFSVQEVKQRTIKAHFNEADLERLVLEAVAEKAGILIGGGGQKVKVSFDRSGDGSISPTKSYYCNVEIVEDLNYVAPVEEVLSRE